MTNIGYLARFDSNGNLDWHKIFKNAVIQSITTSKTGEILLIGHFGEEPFSFYPSESTFNLKVKGNGDIFISKLKINGENVWTKSIGGESFEYSKTISVDSNNNIFVIGVFDNSICLDPNNNQNIINLLGRHSFLAKYDSNCNLLWSKNFGLDSIETIEKIKINSSGEINILGGFSKTIDFDFASNEFSLTSVGNFDNYFAKYTNDGDFVFAKSFSSATATIEVSSFNIDNHNNIYIVGQFKGTVDFDPSPNNYVLTSDLAFPVQYISKYDFNGTHLFTKTTKESSFIFEISDLTIDKNNQFSITGYFGNSSDFDFSSNTAFETAARSVGNSFISTYDENCNYINSLKIGGYSDYPTYVENGKTLAIDNTNNVYVAGKFASSVNFDSTSSNTTLMCKDGSDCFFAKYDASGKFLWAKSIVGGGNYDQIYSMKIGKNGKIYVIGNFSSTADFDPSNSTYNLEANSTTSMFLASYDLDGNFIWAKKIIASNKLIYTHSRNISLDDQDNIYLTGNYAETLDFNLSKNNVVLSSNNSSEDIFLAKYNNNGDFIWAKTLGGKGYDRTRSILVKDYEIYLTGNFQNSIDLDPSDNIANHNANNQSVDIFFAAFNLDGDYLWSKSFGGHGSDFATSIAIDSKKNILIAGTYFQKVDFDPSNNNASLQSGRNSNMFVAKYDSTGNYVWAKSFYCSSTDVTTDLQLILDKNDHIYLTGQLESHTDFDPSPINFYLGSYGSNFGGLFIAKYDPDCQFIWAKNTNYGDSEGVAIALDLSNNLLISGNFNDKVEFNPNNSAQNIISSNSKDFFVAKYSNSIVPRINSSFNPKKNCPWDEGKLSIYQSNNIPSDQWKWYENDCNGEYIGSGFSILISPEKTTTYYVKLATGTDTNCSSVTINTFDTSPPEIKLLPIINSECPIITLDNPLAYDDCSGFIEGKTDTQFPITKEGETIILWSFTDKNGNKSETIQKVIIKRTTEVLIESINNTLIAFPSNARSYQWVDCDKENLKIEGETNATFIPKHNGNYAVIINVNDCEFFSECVLVLKNDLNNIQEVKYYPNPTSSELFLQFENKLSEVTINIINTQGAIVRSQRYNDTKEINFNLNGLNSGAYFIRIIDDNNINVLKVLKLD